MILSDTIRALVSVVGIIALVVLCFLLKKYLKKCLAKK